MARSKSGKPLPTATERADKSLETLIASGGRRFNLRLSKEGKDALQTIVEVEEFTDETAAINQTLIDRSKRLQRRSKNDSKK